MHACIHTYIDLYMFIGLHIYRVSWLIFIFSAENFPHFTLHSAIIIRTKVSAFYPLAIFRIPHFTLTPESQPSPIRTAHQGHSKFYLQTHLYKHLLVAI